MRGAILPVWPETWREIWLKLSRHRSAPKDLFVELYRELPPALVTPPVTASLTETLSSAELARSSFRRVKSTEFIREQALVAFLERAHDAVLDLGGDALANRYFVLVEAFLVKFSLRYDLRRPFTLHPTLPGVFATLMSELKAVTRTDLHLHQLMLDFEDAMRDLRTDRSSSRIKTCIQKQVNLFEALSGMCPGITESTLGRICDQLADAQNNVWPHDRVREAAKNLYGFASDYPGIRHGGTPSSARRGIEMRDLVAISVLFAGMTPYLSHQVDSELIYLG